MPLGLAGSSHWSTICVPVSVLLQLMLITDSGKVIRRGKELESVTHRVYECYLPGQGGSGVVTGIEVVGVSSVVLPFTTQDRVTSTNKERTSVVKKDCDK